MFTGLSSWRIFSKILSCLVCVSWFKFFCQVLSRDLAATLSTLAGELSRSDSEDMLEEQAAVLLELPRNWKMCARSSARSCRKFHCRLSAKSLRRSALCALCLPADLHQVLSTTTFAALWKHSLEASWRSFSSSGANHGSMPYQLVVGAITGVLPVFTSPLRKGHRGVPAAKTQPVRSCARTWSCSETDYQQRSASSEHSCSHWYGCCHFCSLQTAAWHQSAIRLLQAPDSDATKFGPGSTERRGPSVPRQSVSQETPATLLWHVAMQCETRKADVVRISSWWVYVNLYHSCAGVFGWAETGFTCKFALWPNLSLCACGGRRQGLSLE